MTRGRGAWGGRLCRPPAAAKPPYACSRRSREQARRAVRKRTFSVSRRFAGCGKDEQIESRGLCAKKHRPRGFVCPNGYAVKIRPRNYYNFITFPESG